ncbi:hypothetical protein PF006_g26286 [Phytophthora fragariae]|nr:hypothetical protein PF006_g26286 [Phytophthora fragariae]
MTNRPSYPTPKAILRPEPRRLETRRAVTPVLAAVARAPKVGGVQEPPDDHKLDADGEMAEGEPAMPPAVTRSATMKQSPEPGLAKPKLDEPKPDEPKLDRQEEDDAVLIHEGSDLFAEDLESEMAVLPDLSLTAEVKIEDCLSSTSQRRCRTNGADGHKSD